MSNWKSRTYSKHSESHGAALRELGKSVRSPGDGYGKPEVLEVYGESGSVNSGTSARYDDPQASISRRIPRKPTQRV